ncbi:glycine--tRNA ligase subunit beta [Sphingomonas oligophenolica]|uniref:Glycine--tRNA ligase beta subunit n=1 Tax=Sphingomonas oligophenolica TaxID=301154 RepID=A0A502CQ75_9SPHN|nr:glycine--tRNA ligase subunit beta [Sphingomonas oligophenolica]TPG15377.1 glycine--tRNA ligase subunit beta [Sphingomonas oligophenolica]
MTDFLLELRSEEIPARMQDRARDDLAKLFTAELAKAGIATGAIVTYATPRRLTLIARDLPTETQAVTEEIKGPKASAPPQALEGFLRKTGLTREQLTERDGIFFAISEKPGRATAAVLADAIPAIIRAFPWPKSMRWGDASASTESLRWVRPLHGIVALFGDEIVPVEIAGITSSAATLGHRFHHPDQITIGSAGDYVEKLRACHVIVDQDERRLAVRTRAHALAAEAGLALIEDEGLVAENAGLTEWPVPLLGRFDAAYLDVPPEVIQLTARVNQKYFVCRDADGALANAFICTANIDATDGGSTIVEGNRKVLAARLSDAKFFYDTDLKVPLDVQAEKLGQIVFHEKLGTVADKVDRVAKLARWLVEEGIVSSSPARGGGPAKLVEGQPSSAAPASAPPPSAAADGPPPRAGEELALLADLADRAARLAKADLVTGMVGEFPELQGLMGGYYALAQGEDPRVAAAIRDHYKPVGQGDDVPTDPVTVAVSLADKLDTICSFFGVEELPTGSKDPFALRRGAIGIARLILVNNSRASWGEVIRQGWLGHETTMQLSPEQIGRRAVALVVVDFIVDRLKVQQREAGVRHDLIDAVFALGGEDDLVRLLARVRALQAFIGTEDGTNLLAGYKRAANILKKEGYESPSPLVGEGRGPSASADGKGEGDAGVATLTPPHPSGPAGLPPSPTGGEGKIPLSYTPEPAEAALIAALDAAEPAAASAVGVEDFEGAMAALATLRAPIDAFFDSVTVNDPDRDKRAARLALLARVRDAVHGVADFSKIEG